MDKKDQQILKKYQLKAPWGLAVAIDLANCNPQIIRSEKKIKEFVNKLCQLLNLRRFGETVVVDFGEDPKVSGLSMTQLIETSLISGHFANQTNCAYIDVFSCKVFPPYKTAKFCKDFFKGKKMRVNILFRF